ncbi:MULTISPECIES: FAD:protein FMN transferase [Bacillaceae]|uniref:FAD:protein FMN transferase n=1 Tax=Evansella alkalicola TaxID=745819 RepID=A0ABS6JSW3_9BACI|nr:MULTISPECIES: FAD:protein FMN transferase [Bacillaceae]MBU9721663.1 FAD:protein FMN transferase [Bacillus alkalicola]
MKKRVCLSFIIVVIILTGCLSSSAEEMKNNPHRETEILMGTVVTLRIYDNDKEYVMEEAFERIRVLEDVMSVNVEGSEIDRINQAAGIEPVEVSDKVFKLIQDGVYYGADTDGIFDITIGPLTSLWQIGSDEARKPSQDELDEVLPLIDYEKIVLDEENQTVFLQEAGMRLDTGGIAKGYIADLLVDLFMEKEVESAIIDLGGDIYVIGENPSGREFTIGIQDPLTTRGQSLGNIQVKDKSIVTSGIYERFIEVDGVEYHHILDPYTGYPIMNELAGVTIISENTIDGDALSTAVFAKGLLDGLEYVEELEGVDAIFVTRDNEVYISSGITGQFELTNDAFNIIGN